MTAVAPDGAVVGIARYIRIPETSTAEVAVAVADQWRGLGIATLLLVVPIWLATLHQAGALALLTVAVCALHGLRRAGS